MSGRQQLGFAIAAAMAGLAWGYLRHRNDSRASSHALLQALEWFVAYGGAAALIERAQQALNDVELVEEFLGRIEHGVYV